MIGGLDPYEGLGVVLPGLDEATDGCHEHVDVVEVSATQGRAPQEAERDLHHVEPRGARDRKVQGEAGVTLKPPLHRRMLMGGVLVNDRVKFAFGVDGIQAPQEAQELLTAMTPAAFAVDHGRGDGKGGKDGDGTVTRVVMDPALHLARTQHWQGLREVDGLDLAFLSHAEHQGAGRRVQVQPDDVDDLGFQLRVPVLQGQARMRLELAATPDAMDGHVAHPLGPCESPGVPVGPRLRGRQRLRDDGAHLVEAAGRRATRTRVILQPLQPMIPKARPPQAHRRQRTAQRLGDLLVHLPFLRGQNG